MKLFNDNKKKAVEFKDKGNKLFAIKKYKEAVECYNQAIKLDATDAAFFSNRAASYIGMAKFDEALADAEATIKLKPEWAKGYYRKGISLMGRRDHLAAEAAFKEGLVHEPENAEIQKKLKDIEPELVSLRPKFNADGTEMSKSQKLKEEGNGHFKEARYEIAIECYSKAIIAATDEEKSVLYTNRATCHAQLQNYRQVVDDCTASLSFNPKNTKALMRRGLAYEALEKWDAGIEDMKALLALEPGALTASQALQRLLNNKKAAAQFN